MNHSTNIADQSKSVTPVAFFALIDNRLVCELKAREITKMGSSDDNVKLLGIDHLHFYTQHVAGENVIVAMMDVDTTLNLEDPADIWEKLIQDVSLRSSFESLHNALRPHPRYSAASKSPWVKAETICEIRPHLTRCSSNATWNTAVTELRSDKEAEYRLLHNNVWPGVVEVIGNSNISRFDIFLIEFGENQPYLFYRFQYVGIDFERDMEVQSLSPINQRWWKYTDACQRALPGSDSDRPWLEMKEI